MTWAAAGRAVEIWRQSMGLEEGMQDGERIC
jgi:hypothetical protein